MVSFPEYEEILVASNVQDKRFSCVVTTHTIKKHYPLHYHDMLELALVVRGTGVEYINGEPHRLQPGSVTFLRPNQMHEIFCDSDNLEVEIYCCMFDISVLFGADIDNDFGRATFYHNIDQPSYVDLNDMQLDNMTRIFKQMLAEYRGNAFAKNNFVRCKLIEALILYMRMYRQSEHETLSDNRIRSNKMIWEVIQFLNTRYMDDISLEDLARKYGSSVSTISTLIKEALGTTLLQYLHTLRIRRAEGLLSNTTMSIMDVAIETGFQSFRTFSRVFKRIHGVSPREFRNRLPNRTGLPIRADS
ncbi:helix-turn-helix domain-containing protein [Paenibacillus antri]|uniref:Helix-turn-helix domain-containing protein n=1 Tax=Paenibacillus antri TaxID=2582848 RepID=A0A5R9GBQ4_9BACL|nr:AraC family transcriptional regulator [Paenibacillus antri]TLS53887.1 helix-turn-helix domain-containing protein [Paenibacillus antri]